MATNSRSNLIHSRGSFSLKLFLTVLTISCPLIFAADPPKLSKHPVVIIISYDGFRYDYLSKTNTPNLDQVKMNGVSVPYMQNQFLTYTFPNHHTIATGLYPESHGVISNAMYDPLYGKKLSGYDNEPGFWNYSSDPEATSSPIVPLYTLNELAGDDRYSGVMMWPGSGQAWGENNTKATHLVMYNNSITFETRVDHVINWITDPNKPANLVFLYCEEPDSEGHKYGPEGPQMINKIERMDNVTGYLVDRLQKLGIYNDVNLVFLSDHGMQEIKANSIATYLNVIDNSNNMRYTEDGKGSPFLQIMPTNQSDTAALYAEFAAAAKTNHYTAYLRDDLPKTMPHWHYSTSRRIMPIFLVADVGYIFEGYAPKNYSTGAHGFDNNEPSMRPYFMATGPLFKNSSVQEPFHNVDIYPLVCQIMKIEPRPNNGSLDRITPILAAGPPKLSKHPVVIIISYDGFRYDYLSKTNTPNLDQVKMNGVSVPYMQNQFLTYTFPNHHTIATGLYPESHGVISNAMYDPLYGKKLSGYDNEPGFWNYSSDPKATSSPIIPIYTLNELAGDDRYSGVVMWPGSGQAWGDKNTKATHLVMYDDSITFETRVDLVISWITDPNKPANLVFLYCEEPDSEGHKYGPEGPQMINKIERMDNVTGYLVDRLQKLGIYNDVNLVFLSDHGMQEIKANSIATYLNVIENANKTRYTEDGIGSPFLQIMPTKPNDTAAIYAEFAAAAKTNHYTAYLRDDLPKTMPHWHYSTSRRIMPIFLVADVGYIFEGYEPKNYSTGAHGFDNNEPSMRPYFMATGPLFKNNSVQEPFHNVDIYPLVCQIMKIDPRPNNGSLDRITPILAVSSATKRFLWAVYTPSTTSTGSIVCHNLSCYLNTYRGSPSRSNHWCCSYRFNFRFCYFPTPSVYKGHNGHESKRILSAD
ncbi:unnamed protein product [Allacma fusca]|uniref:Uncharacterized protein n=1 Tax=Allacma fusca TaxID=39272 RepID=A0A8J2NMM5_9HEXA|nr:unnamed protein product [Allacma fusca]